MTIRILVFMLLLITANDAFAVVFGGSNLGFMGYPKHNCSKPYKPLSFKSEYELNRYKDDFENYIRCINEYVENANNDIKRVTEAAEEAISEVKRDY
jgi:hypothetical protein